MHCCGSQCAAPQYSAVLPDHGEAMRTCMGLAADMLACSAMGLVLSKQQLNAVADGMSLSAALTAENSHQMLLVNNPEAAKVCRRVCGCLRAVYYVTHAISP